MAGAGIGQRRVQFVSEDRLFRSARFDLDADFLAAAVQQQVNFRSRGRAPKVKLCVRTRQMLPADDFLDDKSFPACAPDRMRVEFTEGADVEEMMQQTGITQVEFRRFAARE